MDTKPISKSCPKCQTPLPADAPHGLCPKCLLAAVATPTEAGQPAGRPSPPPIEEIAAAFPQLEILEFIGQGGMGFVFKARQPKLDRLVALKILPQSLAADPTFAERFNREARLLARLNHPGIVTVHDFGVASQQLLTSNSQPFYYLLMEFVDGVNLRQAMQAGRFTPEQALAIVPKICEALQFAHNEGILHRDIKPENILLDAKGRVKIADFGIAKLMDGRADLLVSQAAQQHRPADANLTEAGKTLGSPNYMAPEQLDHPGEVDHRADIYSLGVVFYEMLTGELPRGRFAPPSQKSAADPRVDEVVLRALEKEKSRRHASADEIRTQVETIAETPDRSRRRGDETQTEKQNAEEDKSQGLLTSSPTMLKSESARLAVQEFSSAGMNFPTMGEVALHTDRLVISAGHYKRSIPLMDIYELGEAVMPFMESPGKLHYAAVDFDETGQRRRLVFLAGIPMLRSLGNTRLHAAEWLTAIQRAIKSGIGRDVPIADVPTVVPVLTWRTFGWLLMPLSSAMLLLTNFLTHRGPESFLMTNAALIFGALMLIQLVILFVLFVERSLSLRGTVKRPLGFATGGAGVPPAEPGVAPAPLVQKPDRFWRWFMATTLAMIVVFFSIAVLGLLAAIAIPNFVKARAQAQANAQRAAAQLTTKTIMLTRATNQLVGKTIDTRTVGVWSDATVSPGEKFRQITRLPDGETTGADASLFARSKAGKLSTSTSFTWWFRERDGFGAVEAEAATAQIREHWTQTPLTFTSSAPREVFCVTNLHGVKLAGSIEFVHTAPQPPDATGQIKATVQVKHFGDFISFPGIGFRAEVPDGYALRATSNYGEGHINSPAGPYDYEATWFPMNYGLRQPAVTALSWNLKHTPPANAPSMTNGLSEKFEILLGQPRLIVSITNSPDDVFQGFLELVGPPEVGATKF